MPELPEVEIAARRLRAALPGRRITGLEVADPKILRGGNALDWQDRLIGATFLGVDRRAKYLLLPLNTNETLIAHLRMTGKLVVDPTPLPPPRHGEGETRSRGSFPPLRAGEGVGGWGPPASSRTWEIGVASSSTIHGASGNSGSWRRRIGTRCRN